MGEFLNLLLSVAINLLLLVLVGPESVHDRNVGVNQRDSEPSQKVNLIWIAALAEAKLVCLTERSHRLIEVGVEFAGPCRQAQIAECCDGHELCITLESIVDEDLVQA